MEHRKSLIADAKPSASSAPLHGPHLNISMSNLSVNTNGPTGSHLGDASSGSATTSTFQSSAGMPSPQFETYPGSPLQYTGNLYSSAQGSNPSGLAGHPLPHFPAQPSQQAQAQSTYGAQAPSGPYTSFDRSSSTSSFSSSGLPTPNEIARSLDDYSKYGPSTSSHPASSYPNSQTSSQPPLPPTNSLAGLTLPSLPSLSLNLAHTAPLSPSLSGGANDLSHDPISLSTGSELQGAAVRVTRAFGMRIVRSARRGQLPFLVVFFTCVVVFFLALLGVGYVDPALSATSLTPLERANTGSTIPGQGSDTFPALGAPIGAAHGPALGANGKPMTLEERRKAEMKKLEAEWSMKKRPKDGLWMQSQRDQRARRRKPLPNSHEEYLQRVQDNKDDGIVGQVFEAGGKE